jgi:hypothetical protein
MKLGEVKDNIVYWDCVFDTIAYYRLLYFKDKLSILVPISMYNREEFRWVIIDKAILREELHEAVKVK